MPIKKKIKGYYSTHEWVRRHYGKASKCEKCKQDRGFRFEWANISGEYKRERSDWMEMCQSCHRISDTGEYCKRGHPYIPKNVTIRQNGNRQCKLCGYIAKKKYLKKLQLLKNEMGKSK